MATSSARGAVAVLACACACACGAACGRGEPASEGAPGSAAPAQTAPARTAPHASAIQLVALADDGSAALTADEGGHVRFWPALDGTREPAIVASPAAVELALARDAGGYVAAVRDEVGAVELVRLAPDGGLRGRVQLPAEPAADELAAVGATVLVRRRDESIARYDARGALLGAVRVGGQQRLIGLAARRGSAVALVESDSPGELGAARTLDVARPDALAWGATIAVSGERHLGGPFALSPLGDRLLAFQPLGTAEVVALTPGAPPLYTDDGTAQRVSPGGGFLDEDHGVVVFNPAMRWFSFGGAQLAHGADAQLHLLGDPPIAVGDGRVIGGEDTSLVTFWEHPPRYLGYGLGAPAIKEVVPAADGVAIVDSGGAIVWLDAQLHERHALPAPAAGEPPTFHAAVIDDARAVIVSAVREPGGEVVTSVRVVDVLAHQEQPVPIAKGEFVLDVAYRAETHELRMLMKGAPLVFRVPPTGLALEAVPAAGGASEPWRGTARPRDATEAVRAGEPLRVARVEGAVVVVRDGAGKDVWRQAAWKPVGLAWTGDGTQLVVVTQSGLASYDAVTGEPRAVACGWLFGAYANGLSASTTTGPSLCEAAP